PAPAPVAAGPADDLTRIKGLGPKLAALLGEFGITTFAQIAAWTPAEIERIDAKLGRFSGRIVRDQWVEQARLLAAGDESGFTARFGNNG
ncbi:helix-hairpin-helix domain-containing protein, partial [Erythrobacter donghaensis]|uniref:helix-hairpin-helix domain-containing protein n=2 Tax=Erythrobacter donghaensis TaxID=267135 RepID=UPI000AEB4A96